MRHLPALAVSVDEVVAVVVLEVLEHAGQVLAGVLGSGLEVEGLGLADRRLVELQGLDDVVTLGGADEYLEAHLSLSRVIELCAGMRLGNLSV